MTDELVKRLRGDWFGYEVSLKAIDAMEEAADRIEQLTAERDRLRALLAEADRRIAWEAHGFGNDFAERVEAALKGESHD